MKAAGSRRRVVGTVLRGAVALAVAAIFVQQWLLEGWLAPLVVVGDSMQPTLLGASRARAGDRLLVNRAALALRNVRRWDVVVLRQPDEPRRLCVKRVLGLPGELVELTRGGASIDGQPLASSPIDLAEHARSRRQKVALAADELYLLGDNAAQSRDSRHWHPPGVPLGLVRGLAVRMTSRAAE